MVLLVEAVGQQGMEPHAVGVVAVLRIGVGQEIGAHAAVQRMPIAAAKMPARI